MTLINQVTLSETDVGTVVTSADGTFSGTFRAPALPFGDYWLNATDDYGVSALASFEIGVLFARNIIITPISGSVGTNVTLTGTGFPPGTYNATFGTIRVITGGSIVEGVIDSWFIVPTIDPGIYDVTVEDSGGSVVFKTFSVHAVPSGTAIVVYPKFGPPGLTVFVSGYGFTQIAGTVVRVNLTTSPPIILGTTTTLTDGARAT